MLTMELEQIEEAEMRVELDELAYQDYINPDSNACKFFGGCPNDRSTTEFCDEHEQFMFGGV